MNVRRGDTVLVLAGKDRGKRGTVERVEKTKRGFGVVIPGINMAKRHHTWQLLGVLRVDDTGQTSLF